MSTRIIQPGEIGADYVGTTNKTRDLFTKSGITFVTRYVKPGHSAYEIVAPERDRLFSWGIAITIVFETHERAIYGGAHQGQIDGYLARLDCEELGYPHACPIFAAVDTDVVKANSDLCNEYLRAFYIASAPYVDGGYFDTEGFKLVADRRPIWCKPNAGGWDGDPTLRPFCHIWQGRQDLTIGWDYPNRVQHPFTAWTGLGADKPDTVHAPTETTKPAPLPPHIEPGDDMANIGVVHLEDADAEFIAIYVGPIDGPRILDLHWIRDAATQALADAHVAAGATVFGGPSPTPGAARLVKANLRNCFVDLLPVGDSRTTWTSPTDIIVKAG